MTVMCQVLSMLSANRKTILGTKKLGLRLRDLLRPHLVTEPWLFPQLWFWCPKREPAVCGLCQDLRQRLVSHGAAALSPVASAFLPLT